jgi:hypothetical protein
VRTQNTDRRMKRAEFVNLKLPSDLEFAMCYLKSNFKD